MKYIVTTNEDERGYARYRYIIEADSEEEIKECIECQDFIDCELLDNSYDREDSTSFEIESIEPYV